MISLRPSVFPSAVVLVILSASIGQSFGQSSQLYWGDLHNHNAVGYGKGSLQRSYDIAESHLDFFAFTPTATGTTCRSCREQHEKWLTALRPRGNTGMRSGGWPGSTTSLVGSFPLWPMNGIRADSAITA